MFKVAAERCVDSLYSRSVFDKQRASVTFRVFKSPHRTPQWDQSADIEGRGAGLLCGDEVDDHVDHAGAAGAAAQVHAGLQDFVLQQLIELHAELPHQGSHLGGKHTMLRWFIIHISTTLQKLHNDSSLSISLIFGKRPQLRPETTAQQIGSIHHPGRVKTLPCTDPR